MKQHESNQDELLQRYLDGDLTPQESRQYEASLAADSTAHQEVEGFKTFKAAMGDVRFAEDVPTRRLEELLQKAKPNPTVRSPWLRFSLAGVFILLMAAGYLGFNYDPLRLDNSSAFAVLQAPSPASAAVWVRSNASLNVPELNIEPIAKLRGAKVGKEWACYDYESDGQTYCLCMSQDVDRIEARTSTCRVKHLDVVEGKGLGWTHCGMAFYLRGGTPGGRMKIAEALCNPICEQMVDPARSNSGKSKMDMRGM